MGGGSEPPPHSINDDAADRFARMHQLEPFVDLTEGELVRDQVVDVDLPLHVPIDNLRHVGPASRAAKGCAFLDAAGDQLERAGGNLLARPGDADDDADTPPPMTAFERLTHGRDIADTFEAVVGTALREIH